MTLIMIARTIETDKPHGYKDNGHHKTGKYWGPGYGIMKFHTRTRAQLPDHIQVDPVIEQARLTVNPERRQQLYYEFQEIFAQEVPSIPLYVPIYTYGVDERIHDVQIGPLVHPSDRFRTVSAWWIVPRRVFVSDAEAGLP